MVYEYARIEQIHSVAQCPPRWAYPVQLLMNCKGVNLYSDLIISPINELADCTDHTTEIIARKEFQTLLPTSKFVEF